VKIIIFFKPNDAPIQDFREAPPEDEWREKVEEVSFVH
jgi:hypothetical protein